MTIVNIIVIGVVIWIICSLCCAHYYCNDECSLEVTILFPANLIFIIKVWIKSIINAIKE